jgi:hypothetical protein
MLRAIVADGDLTGSEWGPRTTFGVERVVLPIIPTKHASSPVEADSESLGFEPQRPESESTSEQVADTTIGKS